MRDYTEYELPEKKEKIYIKSLPEFDIEDYDLSNPKDLTAYFKSIERICRNSRSYKKLIDFLREHVDMTKCSFYKNVNNIDTFSIKIHIHHTPLTLYDIVTTVYAKRLLNHESISELMVAKEVMWCHYNLIVGLIPLSETVHAIVHRGQLFIPTTKVYGMYKGFVELYGPYMEEELKTILLRAEQVSEAYDYKKQCAILEVSPVYIDPSGAYEFPNIQELQETLSRKIDEMDRGIVSEQYTLDDKDDFLNKIKEEQKKV